MWDDFQQLLDYDKDEDLQRMYALLARIPEGLEQLRKKFEEHVKRAGQSAISKLVGEGGANVDSLVCRTDLFSTKQDLTNIVIRNPKYTLMLFSKCIERTNILYNAASRAKWALWPL
jgi:hypothetical protein